MPAADSSTLPPVAPPRSGSPVYALQPGTDLRHPLLPEELETYREKGFVMVREALPRNETAAYREEADRLVRHVTEESERQGLDPSFNLRYERDPATGVAWKVDPFTDVSPVFGALAQDPRIVDRLASIYDGFPPRLFKDKLILKPGGTHGNGLHQDYNWWQGFPHSCLSVSIALDRTTRENGCTELWSGHRRGFLHEAGTLSGSIDPGLLADEEHVHAELDPGDIAIFSCFTPHAAAPNRSDAPRCAIFFSYNDSRDGEWRQAHYDHFFGYRTAGMSEEERAKHYVL